MTVLPTASARTLWPLLAGLCLLPQRAAVADDARDGWEHEATEAGVALYTRDARVHDYDTVKAVVTLEAPAEPILAALRDIERYPRWYHDCAATRVLARPSAPAPVRRDSAGRFVDAPVRESYLLLFVQRSEPLEDRWAVVHNRVRIQRGALFIDFRSLDDYAYPAPKDAVRMRLHGRFILEPLSLARTRVTFELDIDPNTSTPAFLVDGRIHDMALVTLQNLRRLLAQSRRPAPGRGARRQRHDRATSTAASSSACCSSATSTAARCERADAGSGARRRGASGAHAALIGRGRPRGRRPIELSAAIPESTSARTRCLSAPGWGCPHPRRGTATSGGSR